MAKSNPIGGSFSMGSNTLNVSMELFSQNRQKLVKSLKQCSNLPNHSVVLLQGGGDQGICDGDSSDVGPIFKQEGYFHWAFGVIEPDFYGAVDVSTGKSYLFMPQLPTEYATWMGKIATTKEIKSSYKVDTVHYIDEMAKVLKKIHPDPTLLTLNGVNTDSGKKTRPAAFDGISAFKVNDIVLHPIIAECRVIKSELEKQALRYATKVSSEAHKLVMRTIKPGMKEYNCESTFLHYCYYFGGARHVCYNCIAGSGSNGAILHYGHAGAPNDKTIKDGDMVLFDMGCEYYRFCSDVTCSYPANGKFTEKQKLIYNAVYKANRAVMNNAKPGVSYVDMHLLANRILLENLKEGGLIKGNIDDMMAINLAGRVFQPHGLGHFIGMDVHDVGGYLEGHPSRPAKGPGLRNLRTARVLQSGMAITVEPGCYFIDHLLDQALKDPELEQFLVPERIEQFRDFGGVRIEDDILITDTGVEIMSIVPRTVEEIEAWMRGEGELHMPEVAKN